MVKATLKSITTVWQGLVTDNFMDWIEDKRSRIGQVSLVSKFLKLAIIRLHKKWRLLHPFKSCHFWQFLN